MRVICPSTCGFSMAEFRDLSVARYSVKSPTGCGRATSIFTAAAAGAAGSFPALRASFVQAAPSESKTTAANNKNDLGVMGMVPLCAATLLSRSEPLRSQKVRTPLSGTNLRLSDEQLAAAVRFLQGNIPFVTVVSLLVTASP